MFLSVSCGQGQRQLSQKIRPASNRHAGVNRHMREPCYSRMISRLAQIQGPRRIPQTFIAGLVAKHNGSLVPAASTKRPSRPITGKRVGYVRNQYSPFPAPAVADQADGGDGFPVIPTCPISERECSLPFGYSVAAFEKMTGSRVSTRGRRQMALWAFCSLHYGTPQIGGIAILRAFWQDSQRQGKSNPQGRETPRPGPRSHAHDRELKPWDDGEVT
jgi:hypothetical protein